MTGTKDDEAVIRAVLADAPIEAIAQELFRRGYGFYRRTPGMVTWLVEMSIEDAERIIQPPLPFEWDGDDMDEETLSA